MAISKQSEVHHSRKIIYKCQYIEEWMSQQVHPISKCSMQCLCNLRLYRPKLAYQMLTLLTKEKNKTKKQV